MSTNAVAAPAKRKRRYERTTGRVPLQVTDRDAAIILAVGRHRFLNSRHVQALVLSSEDKILRRLEGLYHAGYLDRPRAQLDAYTRTGSKPMVYALANKGAALLNERFATTIPDVDWFHKNQSVGRPFVEHTLAIADAHIALTVSTRARPEIELIDAAALIAAFPTPPVSADRAFLWKTVVRRNDLLEPVSVNADYAFALRSPTISRRCYLVEADRGTMPVVRANLKRTSLARKFEGYIAGYAAQLHERQFGWKAFRVLLITNSSERAENARAALCNLTRATNIRALFYFTHTDALAAGDVLALEWIDGNGQPQTLI